MTDFAATPIPTYCGPDRSVTGIRRAIQNWRRSMALTALVQAWGGTIPEGDTVSALNWLEEFTRDHWDFRRGVERDLVQAEADDREALVLAASRALGLVGQSAPSAADYTHILVLGGLVRACLGRPLVAARLVEGGLHVPAVTGLGGFRELSDGERQLAARAHAPHLADEAQAMDEGLRRAFHLDDPDSDEHGMAVDGQANSRWLIRRYVHEELKVTLVAAPSSEPDVRRANTPDTYAWWAESVERLGPSDRILLVTTDIYVPFQGADAIRMLALPYGCEVETIGSDTSRPPIPALRQTFGMRNYLQEIRSTVRAFRDLWSATSL